MQTFLQIAQYISLMPNSELSTVNGITDVTDEEKNAINRALLQVWNETSYYNFRFAKTTFPTVIAQSDYPLPADVGYIKDKGLRIDGNTSPLCYEPNFEDVTQVAGEPYRYWLEGDNIVLDPIPNTVKTVTMKYRTKLPVITSGLVKQAKFIDATDVLNIPARVECEFIDCIGHMTNLMLNADQTDEDYAEHNLRYKNALAILKQVDRGAVDNFSSITF
jgi:hypothetical protein